MREYIIKSNYGYWKDVVQWWVEEKENATRYNNTEHNLPTGYNVRFE